MFYTRFQPKDDLKVFLANSQILAPAFSNPRVATVRDQLLEKLAVEFGDKVFEQNSLKNRVSTILEEMFVAFSASELSDLTLKVNCSLLERFNKVTVMGPSGDPDNRQGMAPLAMLVAGIHPSLK